MDVYLCFATYEVLSYTEAQCVQAIKPEFEKGARKRDRHNRSIVNCDQSGFVMNVGRKRGARGDEGIRAVCGQWFLKIVCIFDWANWGRVESHPAVVTTTAREQTGVVGSWTRNGRIWNVASFCALHTRTHSRTHSHTQTLPHSSINIHNHLIEREQEDMLRIQSKYYKEFDTLKCTQPRNSFILWYQP